MPAPTRCWCSSSTRSCARPPPRSSSTELLGRADRRGGRRHRRRFHLRQGRSGNVDAARGRSARSTASSPKPSRRCCSTATRISSGRVREALIAGDTGTATRLLSRDFAIEGVVQRGDAARPRARLSDRQPGARRLPAAPLRHLRGARDARRRQPSIPASPASASARPSTRRRSCSRRICSTSTATSTAARSRSRSTPSSARSGSSTSVDALVAEMREDEAQARKLLALDQRHPGLEPGSAFAAQADAGNRQAP